MFGLIMFAWYLVNIQNKLTKIDFFYYINYVVILKSHRNKALHNYEVKLIWIFENGHSASQACAIII